MEKVGNLIKLPPKMGNTQGLNPTLLGNEWWHIEHLNKIGIPKKFRNAEIDKNNSQIQGFLEGRSYYIHGKTGTGKTYLASALLVQKAKEYLEKEKINDNDYKSAPLRSRFVFVPDLFIEIRGSFNRPDKPSEEDILHKYRNIQCLALDDIGAEKTSDWVLELFESLIDYRNREEKQTVFTSNLDLEKLAKKLGDRIASRVTEMCKGNVIEIQGRDRRL